MISYATLLLAGHLVAAPAPLRADVTIDDSLRARIQRRIAQVPGAEVAVAFRDLGSGDTLYLNADTRFHAASTMKVPVMIELFRRVDAGALSLDQGILLVNQFGSIVDGSQYSLNPADDSDSLVYTWVGTRVPVRTLLEHMITRSSNLATNALIALVGAGASDATAHVLGAHDMLVLRGVEDEKAYAAGRNNMTTARDLATLMTAIQENRAASPASCDSMRAILLRQEFNGEIPAGLPPGTPVAHKTGQITAHLHDAAIVYPAGRPPYVLVLLTRGIRDEQVARALMVDVSRLVYEHATARAGVAGAAR
ncbi:MAG TPA: serine hydrolase [Gemmatimonadaceae bacterium]|nr:serine hydrolase [Gemmatimonadaceae bacterium]